MNPNRAARFVRRAMLPVALLLGLWLWWGYGWLRVPAGMDTLPDSHPPGTVCFIAKWPGPVPVESVVFVELPGDDGTLLARIGTADADGFTVAHDNLESRFGSGADYGRLPWSSVRGHVLTQFVPDAEVGDLPRGR